MPWGPQEATKFNRKIAGSSKKKWAAIANSVLADTGDEGKAVRIANSRVRAATRRLNKTVIEKRGR